MPTSMNEPFWKTKQLGEMTSQEWESLCDGCGRCCLNKIEDWDTGEIHLTNIACTLLDHDSCQCSDYKNRFDTVPDCIQLTPEKLNAIGWLPASCAYRIVAEGRELHWWHPLVSGNQKTIHEAGISVRGNVVSEDGLSPEDYEDYLISDFDK